MNNLDPKSLRIGNTVNENYKAMNNLEKEIYEKLCEKEGIKGIEHANPISASICEGSAKAAASVAIRWMELAFIAGGSGQEWTGEDWITITNFKEFKQENGLSEPTIVKEP